MQKSTCSIIDAATGGFENISDHLAWLFGWAIRDTGAMDGVISIVCNPDLPPDLWGRYHPDARAIVLNLDQHFEHMRSSIQDEESMNFSASAFLLRSLMDTIFHEAWHAARCLELKDFAAGDLDEGGAKKYAWKSSWAVGELYDVEMASFGKQLDAELLELFKELKEDVTFPDCKEWKKIQLHMFENNLSYYNPDNGVEMRTVRELMNSVASEDSAWIETDNKLFHKFSQFTPLAERLEKEEAEAQVDAPVVKPREVVPPVPTPEPVAPVSPQPTYDDYDPIYDIACKVSDEEDSEMPNNFSTQPIQPVTPVAQPNPIGLNVEEMQNIGEVVMRRIFHHVFSKCGFMQNGTFSNPGAALEPIHIGDIPNVEKLIVKQDCYVGHDNQYHHQADVEGKIRGLVTQDGLPKYQFYIQVGNEMQKRVFIPANPNSRNADGTLKAWAEKSRQGYCLMSLQQEGGRASAGITLEPNQHLGQECFAIWNTKK